MALTPVLEKLNLKDQKQVLVLNAPESFEGEIAAIQGRTILRRVQDAGEIEFSIAFVTRHAEVERLGKMVCGKATGDAVVWFAYPKQSSKKYASEITRDRGWRVLGDLGFEPVRAIAIDQDWTALRFRRAEFIKAMTRDPRHAMSAKGKAKSRKRG